MDKKLLSIIFIAVLFATAVFADEIEEVFINTNGYEWLQYSKRQKRFFVTLIYTKLGVDEEKYPANKIINTLDHLYDLQIGAYRKNPEKDINKTLRLPCLIMLSGFIDELKAEVIDDFKPESNNLYLQVYYR